MTKQEIIDAVGEIVAEMRDDKQWVPRDTGNLADHGIDVEDTNVTQGYIHITITEEAPYAPFTNEPWISAYWNGKKNPNEGWFQRFAEELTRRLAAKLKGVIR